MRESDEQSDQKVKPWKRGDASGICGASDRSEYTEGIIGSVYKKDDRHNVNKRKDNDERDFM